MSVDWEKAAAEHADAVEGDGGGGAEEDSRGTTGSVGPGQFERSASTVAVWATTAVVLVVLYYFFKGRNARPSPTGQRANSGTTTKGPSARPNREEWLRRQEGRVKEGATERERKDKDKAARLAAARQKMRRERKAALDREKDAVDEEKKGPTTKTQGEKRGGGGAVPSLDDFAGGIDELFQRQQAQIEESRRRLQGGPAGAFEAAFAGGSAGTLWGAEESKGVERPSPRPPVPQPPRAGPQPITVFFVFPLLSSVKLSCATRTDCSGIDLFDALRRIAGITQATNGVRMVFRGREIANDSNKSLAELKVEDLSVIHVMLRPPTLPHKGDGGDWTRTGELLVKGFPSICVDDEDVPPALLDPRVVQGAYARLVLTLHPTVSKHDKASEVLTLLTAARDNMLNAPPTMQDGADGDATMREGRILADMLALPLDALVDRILTCGQAGKHSCVLGLSEPPSQ